MLLAVPNVSEGRNPAAIEAIGRAFTATGGVRLLDVHSDPDHHRSVYTLAGEQGLLLRALVSGAREAAGRIEVHANDGVHPRVGAIDVVPLVYLDGARRGQACAEALATAHEIARALSIPVFLYGILAGGRTRACLRRGGIEELSRRLGSGELRPDFGPARAHATAGAMLVAARAPLVAFNLELAPPAGLEQARRAAAEVREGGVDGLPGVRALGVMLEREGVAQLTCNVEDPFTIPLARLVKAVRRRVEVSRGELIGLAPRAAFEDFPGDLPIPGFDPRRHLIEEALTADPGESP